MMSPRSEKAITILLLSFLLVKPSQAACATANSAFNWVFLDGFYYWIGDSSFDYVTAKCVCEKQTGQVRLAIFDPTVTLDTIRAYFYENHGGKLFWVDATREQELSGYMWGNGYPLQRTASLWATDDPGPWKSHVSFRAGTGTMLYKACLPTAEFRPLCQSVTKPPPFATSPPVILKWVSLGQPEEEFAFSTDLLTFAHARDICTRQAGLARLASLDKRFEEVKQYIYDNYPDQQFWVDAFRPANDTAFMWGSGQAVAGSLWGDNEPHANDLTARLTMREMDIRLAAKPHGDFQLRYVCQRTTVTTNTILEWRLFTPSKLLFGFAMSAPLDGFNSSGKACKSEFGDVWLANLDSAFPGVTSYVLENFPPTRQFWVHGTRATPDDKFQWSNGILVDNSFWHRDEPSQSDLNARLIQRNGTVLLAGRPENVSFHFLCQGNPVGQNVTKQFVLQWNITAGTTTPVTTTRPVNTTTSYSTPSTASLASTAKSASVPAQSSAPALPQSTTDTLARSSAQTDSSAPPDKSTPQGVVSLSNLFSSKRPGGQTSVVTLVGTGSTSSIVESTQTKLPASTTRLQSGAMSEVTNVFAMETSTETNQASSESVVDKTSVATSAFSAVTNSEFRTAITAPYIDTTRRTSDITVDGFADVTTALVMKTNTDFTQTTTLSNADQPFGTTDVFTVEVNTAVIQKSSDTVADESSPVNGVSAPGDFTQTAAMFTDDAGISVSDTAYAVSETVISTSAYSEQATNRNTFSNAPSEEIKTLLNLISDDPTTFSESGTEEFTTSDPDTKQPSTDLESATEPQTAYMDTLTNTDPTAPNSEQVTDEPLQTTDALSENTKQTITGEEPTTSASSAAQTDTETSDPVGGEQPSSPSDAEETTETQSASATEETTETESVSVTEETTETESVSVTEEATETESVSATKETSGAESDPATDETPLTSPYQADPPSISVTTDTLLFSQYLEAGISLVSSQEEESTLAAFESVTNTIPLGTPDPSKLMTAESETTLSDQATDVASLETIKDTTEIEFLSQQTLSTPSNIDGVSQYPDDTSPNFGVTLENVSLTSVNFGVTSVNFGVTSTKRDHTSSNGRTVQSTFTTGIGKTSVSTEHTTNTPVKNTDTPTSASTSLTKSTQKSPSDKTSMTLSTPVISKPTKSSSDTTTLSVDPKTTSSSTTNSPFLSKPPLSFMYKSPRSCSCVSVLHARNTTSKAFQQELTLRQRELQVQKQNLSASRRQRTSAWDHRPSAQALGITGVGILLLFLIGLIVPDVVNIVKAISERC